MLLGRLGRAAYRHRGLVVLLWLLAALASAALAKTAGGQFSADYSAPGSDSKQAQETLARRFPAQSTLSVTVVIRAASGAPAVRGDATAMLRALGAVPHVAAVEDPYRTPGGVSTDGRTILAHLSLDLTDPDRMPVADGRRMIDIADDASWSGMRVALGGPTINAAEQGSIGSEGIGLAIAAVILLVTFGTVVAAGLPIGVAVLALVVSGGLTGLLLRVIDAPGWSTSLATMMSIGIGIDYVLLMATRFRDWRAAGLDPETATAATIDTAGRSVLVAGGTVVVSLLGLFGMGVSYMRGAAVVTIAGVLVVLLATMTLLPALLGYFGPYVNHLPVRPRRRSIPVSGDGHVMPSRVWWRWSTFVERHKVLAATAATTAMVGLALPFLSVQFGFPDAGNNPAGSTSRRAYDLIADGFGPGANGPLLIVCEPAALPKVTDVVRHTAGVATVSPPRINPAGDTAVLTVYPATGPQDARTVDLVHRLRQATTENIGGVTATAIDGTADLTGRIPYLIGGVLAASLLLLLAGFRSVGVALKAALMNLLSVAAAYGVVALVLQGGWLGRLVGIDTRTPLPPFVPVLMFAILFGLSMDYEVFLVSRMRESWTRNRDNRRAVTDGLAGTGRVITAAALIMIAVFLAFVPSPEVIIKVIGVGLASAILLDATVVRLLLVPAAMHLMGRFNWWLPRWLDRVLPELHIEGRPERYLPGRPRTTSAAQGRADLVQVP